MSNNIKLTVLENESVYVLTFDRQGSSANIFDTDTLNELDERLKTLSGDTNMRGLIFASAKNSIFIAGADINQLASVKSEEELLAIIKLGQQVFNRIASFHVPTVAAIHGAALGGGYELCLACDYRIATKDKATQIGLPETMLGILPVWGGATRLPRLIGIPKALDIILGGKKLAAAHALKVGMVDELVPREHLIRFALKKIDQGKPQRSKHRLTNNFISAKLIAKKVKPQVLKKTHGHYPAIPKALEVITRGATTSIENSLKLEQGAIKELVKTSACTNLIRIFQLQERSKKLGAPHVVAISTSDAKTPFVFRKPQIRRTAVLGAGVMGAGIAQWISARGLPVILKDINNEQVARGMTTIAKLYKDAVKRRILDATAARRAMNLVSPASTDVPFKNVDVVIEAAVENMDLKQRIFHHLGHLSANDTILATNTSALSITTIAEKTVVPERVIGLHFFNPVHRMQLVEIVIGKKTHPGVTDRALKFVQQIGKLPVLVKDSPGFLVNRVLMPYLVEAGQLFEKGASPEDIDKAMLDFGMPMGPLRLLDEVGIDVAHHVAHHLAEAFHDRMSVPKILHTMMENKWLGKKSGSGFYAYSGKNEVGRSLRERRGGFGETALPANRFHRDELQRRMVLLMVNEAARCLEEQIVSAPEDVDFAMIMGTGFAPFRGGPLRYADTAGISELVDELLRFAEKEKYFQPCALLTSMAVNNKTFYS